MSLKSIGALTIIALGLSACSSGGGSSLSAFELEAKASKQISLTSLKSAANEDLNEELAAWGEDGVTLDTYKIQIGNKTYTNGGIQLSALGNGLQRLDVTETGTAKVDGETYTVTRKNKLYLYQQPYSVVGGLAYQGITVSGPGLNGSDMSAEALDIDTVKGATTKVLPSEGKFTYNGVAFTEEQQGKLAYNVDFAARTGSGSISGITEAGTITLKEGSIANITHNNPDNTRISGFGIEATAESALQGNGTYKLGFFGPNAEEIAGAVTQHGESVVGFGGKR